MSIHVAIVRAEVKGTLLRGGTTMGVLVERAVWKPMRIKLRVGRVSPPIQIGVC